VSIAFLDVHYSGSAARAACVLAESWEAAAPSLTRVQDIGAVAPYEPGSFYRRELPCLLAVLQLLPAPPDIAVVDGYVWLAPGDRPGLGAHLYQALGRTVPVVGIAKTAFSAAASSSSVIPVLRGASGKPLFITAVGMAPEVAAEHVRRMAGSYRIPSMVSLTDRLTRGSAA
jgi:deoxyribonuclease V